MSQTHLIAFCDGSYKKVTPTAWKHSQWIHFTLEDGSCVMVNPQNVNYIHRGIGGKEDVAKDKLSKALIEEVMQSRQRERV